MTNTSNFKPHRYIAIFRGRSCIEVRIDTVPKQYISKLRKVKLTKQEIEDHISINYKLYQKVLNEQHADELHILGMGDHGLIQVYENTSQVLPPLDKLGQPIYEDDGIKKIVVKTKTPKPTPNSNVVACLCAQDGVIGHIELDLELPFDPSKLTLILTSGSAYATDSAITGIEYLDGKNIIAKDLDSSEYLYTYPKVEIFFCSNYDNNGSEIPLFEDGEWVNNT